MSVTTSRPFVGISKNGKAITRTTTMIAISEIVMIVIRTTQGDSTIATMGITDTTIAGTIQD